MTERNEAFYETVRYILEHPQEFVLLDTETTGLGFNDEIVEIALLDLEGNVLLDTLVKPGCPIAAAARAVHHISDAMVSDAPSWLKVWPQVEALLKGRRLLAYNALFDVRMIKQTCRAHGLKAPKLNSLCMMELVTGWLGFRPKLEYFSNGSQNHRAADDCRIILEQILKANDRRG